MLILKRIAKVYVRGVLVTFTGLHLQSFYDCCNSSEKNFKDEFKKSFFGTNVWSVGWPILHPIVALDAGEHGKYIFAFWLALILIP